MSQGNITNTAHGPS
uniref:Uncharacterized protein n=1 Tax=Anguilla anguilla TaxID=7936 RepID=A0A0E9R2Y8_ANGAN